MYYAAFAMIFVAAIAFLAMRRSWYAGGGIAVFERISPWKYALSEPGVIANYLRLSLWPVGQCFDYRWPVAESAGEILPPLALIGLMMAATVWCIFRQPGWGFLGGAFFLILAPTSSVIPIIDLAFEHRMYLPLAPLVVAGTIAGWELGRWWARRKVGGGESPVFPAIVAGLVIVALATATILRNRVYESGMSLWRDVVERAPHNARACANVATNLLFSEGPTPEAMDLAKRAIEFGPNEADGYNAMGLALTRLGRPAEAEKCYEASLRLDPDQPEIRVNLGNVLRFKSPERAIECYREALRLKPDDAKAHNNLGNLLQASAPEEACEHYRAALRIAPEFAEAHNNYGALLVRRGNLAEAIEHFELAIRLRPDFADARDNLRNAMAARKGQTTLP